MAIPAERIGHINYSNFVAKKQPQTEAKPAITPPAPHRLIDRLKFAVSQISVPLEKDERAALVAYGAFSLAPEDQSIDPRTQKNTPNYYNKSEVTARMLGVPESTVRTLLDQVCSSDKLIDAFERLEGKMESMAKLDNLSPVEMDRIDLRKKGLSYAQIAEQQGVALSTIKNFFSSRGLTGDALHSPTTITASAEALADKSADILATL